MRPGRFHPGNIGSSPAESTDESAASMRPGRFHPGNIYGAVQRWPHDKGFNEAGAFPPRKS